MSSKIHPNEEFLKKLSIAELELLMLEAQLPDSSARYVAAFKEQLTRLEIKL